jgi:amino acid adenylation domain-containing protein
LSLAAWDDGLVAPPPITPERDRGSCLHEIIEAWAVRRPNARAVHYEGDTLTYGALNARANRLARRLRARGIGVGALVGVAMKRSLEMVVGLLAILKAGAAYVPLDPRLPRERLLFLVADAPLRLILTNGRTLDAGAAEVLDLQQFADSGSGEPGFVSGVANDDLVYVIYTSGSTGQPKGVMVPHRGVVNWLVWMRNTFAVTPDDVVLKKAPLTFDVSAWELFLPLISGACLVLADSDRQFDPRYLADLMAHTRVSIAQFVPSLMRSFLELEELPDLSALRHVMCGGEVLTPKLQALFLKRLDAEVCNSYGPTEASIGVTRWPCRRDDQRETVPIGWAIDNTELYILDPQLNPVPPGVAGELYIGGICLGRGYLNRPDLTAERFLPNPFNAAGEARMYRTGDMCRFLADGSIDFLGRIDDQVKIRGMRIELAEVEKAIAEHPAVEVAAAAAAERDGEAVLRAYVVPAGGTALSERELRGFLRGKLPLAMIPGEFRFVDALPLSANGKIDRKKLQQLHSSAPVRARARAEVDRSAPAAAPARDAIEHRVAAIWTEALGHERFGSHDDFFDCGGDSLSAIDLLIRLERGFERRVCFDELLGGFTVTAIADMLRADMRGQQSGRQRPASPPARGVAQSLICRIADMDDLPGIWQVCTRAFPAYANATLAEFGELCRYRWLDNPSRSGDEPFGWVLEAADGRIVGFHGLVPIRLWLGDRSCPAVAPTTWASEADYGKAGLAMLSEYMNWGSDRFLLNTTANAITSTIHGSGAYGMRPIPLADFDQRLLWILDFKALLRWKLSQGRAPRLLRRLVSSRAGQSVLALAAPFAFGVTGGVRAALTAGLRGMRIRYSCRPLQIEPIARFGAEFDALWDGLKGRHGVTMERSAAFLNWRHIDPPRLLGRSFALACRDNGRLVGYVALRAPANTVPGHFIMTDLFYDDAVPEALPNLLNAAFAFAISQSATVFEIFGFHPSLNRRLRDQHPYVLHRSALERIGRGASLRTLLTVLDPRWREAESTTYWYRAPNAELERVCAAGAWWPSGVDGDLNL